MITENDENTGVFVGFKQIYCPLADTEVYHRITLKDDILTTTCPTTGCKDVYHDKIVGRYLHDVGRYNLFDPDKEYVIKRGRIKREKTKRSMLQILYNFILQIKTLFFFWR